MNLYFTTGGSTSTGQKIEKANINKLNTVNIG